MTISIKHLAELFSKVAQKIEPFAQKETTEKTDIEYIFDTLLF